MQPLINVPSSCEPTPLPRASSTRSTRRFREHTIELFKKHGMEVIGFWSPTGEKATPNTLVYLLAYPSQQARETMWKAFMDDPEWKKVYAESQKDGSLVTKVESTMLAPTDYSPMK